MRKLFLLTFSILLFCHLQAQNVGIGTGIETPTEQLQLGNFSSYTNTYLLINTTGGNLYRAGIKLRHYSDEHGFTLVSDETQANFKILRHIYNSNGELAFLIDGNNGNVAIGYPAATNKLSVNGTADFSKIGVGTNTPAPSAALDVSSTTSGFLPPRMTTYDRNMIASPAEGLVIYNTERKDLEFYNGIQWKPVTPASSMTWNWSAYGSILTLTDGPDYKFLGPTVTINVLSGEKVMVTSTAAFGTTSGAVLTKLALSYQVTGGSIIDPLGDHMYKTQMAANQRIPITLTSTFSNLPAGTYTFGIIYQADPGQSVNWNFNDYSRTQVSVF